MIQRLQNKKARFIAVGVAAILIASIFIPKFVNAMMIYNLWDNPAVAPTWTSAPDEWLAANSTDPKYSKYKKTGLAMNTNFYFGVNKAGFAWPLGGQMYVEERPGYDNTGYENFNLRHTFCTGNHESAVGITPGARAYHSGTYWYTDDLAHMFEEAKKGEIKFNFLMMALGCYYPGDYTINKNAGSIAEDSAAAQAVVSQVLKANWDKEISQYNTAKWHII